MNPFCEALKKAIEKAPNEQVKQALQRLYDEAGCGGATTQDNPNNPPGQP